MIQETCRTCKYFDAPKGMPEDTGMCRRYPPVLIVTPTPGEGGRPTPMEVSKFPLTGTQHWCGEHVPKILTLN